jgi:flagellar hook-length control protein FliK
MKIDKIQASTPSKEKKNTNLNETENELFISILSGIISNFNSSNINFINKSNETTNNLDTYYLTNNLNLNTNINKIDNIDSIPLENIERNFNTLTNITNCLINNNIKQSNIKNYVQDNFMINNVDQINNFDNMVINNIKQKLILLINEKINSKEISLNNSISILNNVLKNNINELAEFNELKEIEDQLSKICYLNNNKNPIMIDKVNLKTNNLEQFQNQNIQQIIHEKIESINEIISIVANRIKNVKNEDFYVKNEDFYELKIILKPKEFGEINIQISYNEGKINGNITSSNKEVANMLQNNLSTLKEQIKHNEHNYKEININVNVEDNNRDKYESNKYKVKKNIKSKLFKDIDEQENFNVGDISWK